MFSVSTVMHYSGTFLLTRMCLIILPGTSSLRQVVLASSSSSWPCSDRLTGRGAGQGTELRAEQGAELRVEQGAELAGQWVELEWMM